MELTLRSERLVNFVKSIDEFNIGVAIANKTTWFPKLATDGENGERQIRDMYHRLLTLDTSGKGYPPRCHTKTSPEELSVTILDEQTNSMTVGSFADVQKRSEGIPIVRLVGYWFQPRQWGMSIVTKHFLMNRTDGASAFPFVWAGPAPVMESKHESSPSAPSPVSPDDVHGPGPVAAGPVATGPAATAAAPSPAASPSTASASGAASVLLASVPVAAKKDSAEEPDKKRVKKM